MSKTPILILISAVLVISTSAGIYFFMEHLQDVKPASSATITPASSATVKSPASKQSDKKTQLSIQKNSTETLQRSSHSSVLADELHLPADNKLSILNLWFELADGEEVEGIRLNKLIEINKKIGIHGDALAVVSAGNYIELPRIDGKRYILKLINTHKINNSRYELSGEMRIDGKTYYSNLNVSKRQIYGLLETPEGEFNVRMNKNKGYLYRANQLDEQDILGGETSTDTVTDIPGFLNM